MLIRSLQNIKSIAAGHHSAAITSEGKLFLWGPALSSKSNFLEPQELQSDSAILSISIGGSVTAIIDQSNKVYTWGGSNNCG
jgi:alpha-tubulin suppressor-like RCC1 family protein